MPGPVSMRSGERFPDDQAELVISDEAIEWIADNLTASEQDEFLDDLTTLFRRPWGKHPLSNRSAADHLAGLNTASTLSGDHRIVFRSTVSAQGTGLIEVIAIGPRTSNRIYDAVNALVASGKLDDSITQQIWDLLALLEDTVDRYGLEPWDYLPPVAAEGLVKAAVASGVLPEDLARLMSADEITEAMAHGWDENTGQADPGGALGAALARVGGSADPEHIFASRGEPRCGAQMPRADRLCIRRRGHPGAHRSR
ncbi:hypothetical protein [Acidipropionibacterium virtanenii]|nr:hypothetical protein [Acidipropionibacterium virtanenii]